MMYEFMPQKALMALCLTGTYGIMVSLLYETDLSYIKNIYLVIIGDKKYDLSDTESLNGSYLPKDRTEHSGA